MTSARLIPLAMVLAIAATAGACSTRQLYEGGQARQRNECLRILDHITRQRCLENTALGYDEYQEQLKNARRSGSPASQAAPLPPEK